MMAKVSWYTTCTLMGYAAPAARRCVFTPARAPCAREPNTECRLYPPLLMPPSEKAMEKPHSIHSTDTKHAVAKMSARYASHAA